MNARVDPGVQADYFDGRSARPREVTLHLTPDALHLHGDGVALQVPRRQVQWPERTRHGARVAHLPDGGSLQAHDAAAWDAWLRRAGEREGWVVTVQQSWRGVLVATLLLVTLIGAGYRWGLPWASGALLALVPVSADEAVGRAAFASMDGDWLQPSRLPAARREQIVRSFAEIVARAYRPGERPAYELHFRHSPRMGPNAFALPGGTIVVTDQLVQLLQGQDDALLGVLAHELGHVRHRHGMRSVVQVGVMGTVTGLVLGDFSSIVAGAPVLFGQLAYSRDFERQADEEAIALLQATGRSPAAMVVLFDRLAQARETASRRQGAEGAPQREAGGPAGSAPGGASDGAPGNAPGNASGGGSSSGSSSGSGSGSGSESGTDPRGERAPRPGRHRDREPPFGIALSSHPADAERIARFRAAAASGQPMRPRLPRAEPASAPHPRP